MGGSAGELCAQQLGRQCPVHLIAIDVVGHGLGRTHGVETLARQVVELDAKVVAG